MIPAEVRKKIRHLEISTRRLVSGSLLGDNRSPLKGFGFDFDQIREYRAGDDVRFIDWKSSLRTNQLLVKQYVEERNRRIIIAVDVSESSVYGSTHTLRSELNAQIAAVLALAASYSNDAVGLLLFSDHIECFLPPARGRAHTQIMVERLFCHIAKKSGTHIATALNHLAALGKERALVFLISDFIDQGFEKILRCVSHQYEIIALRCIDRREKSLQHIGFLTMYDPESKRMYTIDTRAHSGAKCSRFLQDRIQEQNRLFVRNRIAYHDIEVGKPFMGDLITFFARRMAH
jgi:uncharacterized protein (DUF58 family)